jgi:hypothetical protein
LQKKTEQDREEENDPQMTQIYADSIQTTSFNLRKSAPSADQLFWPFVFFAIFAIFVIFAKH